MAKKQMETINIPVKRAGTRSRLILVVEYESGVDRSDLMEIVEAGRQYGAVAMAQWEHVAPTVEDLV
jgi:hypothetical protein